MSIRLTPHILSSINWDSPLDDPIRRQFITLKSGMLKDHRMLTLDSLGEQQDSRMTTFSSHELDTDENRGGRLSPSIPR